jgi:phospholipase/carboxylesterase
MKHTYIFQKSSTPDAPTLLLLHGTGGDERDLLPLARQFPGEWNVLSIRGNVLENGMPRFFRRISFGVFDEADITRRADDLAEFILELADKEGFDPERIFAVGYSNGANIAGALLVQRPGFFAGAVLWRPMQPFQVIEPFTSPRPSRLLLTTGAMDPTVRQADSEKWARLLADAGYQVSHEVVRAGHELTQQDIALAVKWLETSPE